AVVVGHVIGVLLFTFVVGHQFLWRLRLVLVGALFVHLAMTGLRVLRKAGVNYFLAIMLAAYWLVQVIVGVVSTTVSDIYAGNQEVVLEGLRSAIRYLQAFDLFQYGRWGQGYGGWLFRAFYFVVPAFALLVFLLHGRR